MKKFLRVSLWVVFFVSVSFNGFGQAPGDIISTTPTTNSSDAALTTNVSVSFNDIMISPSASNSAMRVIGNKRGSYSYTGGGTYSGNNTTVISYDPVKNFLPGELLAIINNGNTTNGVIPTDPSTSYFWAGAIGGFAQFSAFSTTAMSDPYRVFTQMENADLDGDNDLDLVFLYSNAGGFGSVAYCLNTGSGSFAAPAVILDGTATTLAYSFAVGDCNNDGDIDVVINQNTTTDNLRIFNNGGTANFTAGAAFSVSELFEVMSAVDIDSDGDLDIVACDRTGTVIKHYVNNGFGGFSGGTTILSLSGVYGFVAGDFNGDRRMDIASIRSSSAFIRISLQASNGTFTTLVYNTGTNTSLEKIKIVDLDGDGDLDVGALNTNDNVIVTMRNDGAGAFSSAATCSLTGSANDFDFADLDGDDDLDMSVITSYNTGTIAVINNILTQVFKNTNGNLNLFQSRIVSSTPNTAPLLVTGDFDGDGDIDVIEKSNPSGSVQPLRFMRNDNSSPVVTTSAISGPLCIGSSLTISWTVSGTLSGNTFSIQLSNATGSFATPTILGTLSSNTSGSFVTTVPSVTPGSGYRIRVLPSMFGASGNDNGSDLGIYGPPSASVVSQGCSVNTTYLHASSNAATPVFTWTPSTGLNVTTGADVEASPSAATTYTVTATDTNGCTMDSSITVLATCYCQSISAGGGCTTVNITNVTLNTLANSTGCTSTDGNAFNVYPTSGSTTTTLVTGNTYTLGVTNGGTVNATKAVWFDWDGSTTFDASEFTLLGTNVAPGTINSVSITVPLTTSGGIIGVRVRDVQNGTTMAAGNACTNYATGETEDYFITVDPPSVSAFNPSVNNDCAAITNNVVLSYNTNMGASAASSANFIINAQKNGVKAGAYSGSGTSTITFNPTNNFKRGEKVFVTLTGNILSSNGAGIGDTYTYEFFAAAGPGPATFVSNAQSHTFSANVSDIGVADFNNDGNLDYVALITGAASTTITQFLGTGTGTFAAGTTITTPFSNPLRLEVGDMDNDGDADFVISYSASTNITLFRNNGSASYATVNSSIGVTGSNTANDLALADFDGDGDLDIAADNRFTQQLLFLRNNGTGTFSLVDVTSTGKANLFIVAGDFNNDFAYDVAVYNITDATVDIYTLKIGSGFSLRTSFGTGGSAFGLKCLDLNDDGNLDIAYGDFANDLMRYRFGQGDFNFGLGFQVSGIDAPAFADFADLDGDCDLDMVFASAGQVNDMAVFKNDGSGSFTAQTALNGSRRPQIIKTGDFDNDGDIDIIGVNTSTDQPSFFRNASYSITASVPAGPYCSNPTITVSWTATDSLASNLMTYELSDASGSFASATILGTATQGGISGSLSVTIPSVVTGTGYRIRVRPTLTPITVVDNGTNLGIGTTPVVSVTTSCASATSTTLTAAAAATYLWSPGTGLSATNTQTVTASPASPTNYTLTLSNSGCSASRVISVGDKCYCYPTYSGNCSADFVQTFNLNTLSFSGTCSGNLRNFNVSPSSSFTTTLNQLSTYTVSVDGASTSTATAGVWIDYNQDGDYGDANEFIFASPASSNLQSTTFTVPGTSLTGTTRVRVLVRNSFTLATSADFCSSNVNGETRDFIITIAGCIQPTAFTVGGGGSYCSGGSGLTVTLSSSQFGKTYSLLLNGTPTGATISGTNAPLTFGSLTSAGTYTISASDNTTGCTALMTGSATITVNPLPTAFNVTGGGTLCSGGSGVSVNLSGSASGITYTLVRNGLINVTTLAGNGSALSFTNITTAGTYTVNASNNTTSCTNAMSGSVSVTVNSLPTAFSVSGGGSYCSGGAGSSVSLSNTQTNTTYQLLLGGSPTGITQAGTGSGITFNGVTAAGLYTIQATNNSTSCTNMMTGSASVSVQALPTLYTVSGGGPTCASGSGATINLSGSDLSTNYQLLLNSNPTGNIISGTGSPLSYTGITAAGTYTVVASSTSGLTCTNTMSGSATVTITASPTVTTVSPSANTSNTNLNSNTNTTFGAAMSGASASASSAAVYGSQSGLLAGAYSLQSSSTIVRFNPTIDFKAGEDISVIHNINTSSSAGCAVGQPYTYSFKAKGAVAPATFFQQNFSQGENFNDIKLADVNEDGFIDYIGVFGDVKVALNNGSGWHGAFTTYSFGSTIDAELGDYDKDGDVDILVLNRFNSQVTRLRNNGSGIFTALAVITIPISVTNDIIMEDFNGDGFLDFAVSANNGSTNNFIYIYNGNGTTFSLAQTISTSFLHTNMVAGDFNNDFLPDIATANSGDGFIDKYFNQAGSPGQLVYFDGASSGLGTGVGKIIKGDFNGDGNLDVVAIRPATNSFSFMSNSGTGALSANVNALGFSAEGITSGDYDGDGDMDLVFGYDGNHALQLYKNNAGAFTFNSDLNGLGTGLASGDLNNDGDIDIAAAPLDDNFDLLFYLDNTTVYTTTVTSVNATPVCAGSTVTVNWTVNQSFPAGNLFTVQLSDNTGSFASPVTLGSVSSQVAGSLVVTIPLSTVGGNYQVRVSSNTATSTAVASSSFVINDSPPLATVSGGGNICPGGAGVSINLSFSDPGVEYRMYLSGSQVGFSFGNGGFLSFTNYTTPGVYTIEGDYDGSGCTTLMSGSATITALTAPVVTSVNPLQNDNDINRNSNISTTYNVPLFSFPLLSSNHYWGSQSGYLNNVSGATIGLSNSNKTIDFNPGTNFFPGEIISTTNSTSNISSSGCSPTTGFVSQFTAKAASAPFIFNQQPDNNLFSPNNTVTGDLDNDGDIDFVSVHGNIANGFRFLKPFLNDGAGNFTAGTSINLGSSVVKVRLADIDNDKDLDAIILQSSGGNGILISTNNGAGLFNGSVTTVATGGGSHADFDIADLDWDGKLDISMINTGPARLIAILNTGALTFNSPQTYNLSNTPNRVANGDFNNDGFMDAAVTSSSSSVIEFYYGDASGDYGSPTTVSALAASQPFYILPFDANGDNKLDFATTNFAGSKPLSVYINSGNGTSYTRTDFTTLTLGQATTGDFDGDGDIDIVSTNASFACVKLVNDGSGSFNQTSFFTTHTVSEVSAADMDGDNDIDFMVTSSDGVVFAEFNEGLPVISINNLSGVQCTPTSFNFAYSTSGGVFVSGNNFNVELSNASGSFASPTTIGSLNTTNTSDTIPVTIPGGTAAGTGYKIRVVSTIPVVTSNSTAAFTISATPQITSTTPVQNSIDINRNVTVKTLYDMAMDGTSLNTKNFYHGSQSGLLNNITGSNFGLTNSNQSINFGSANNYFPGEVVTTINTDQNNSTGGCPPKDHVFQFTTKTAVAPFLFEEKPVALSGSVYQQVEMADMDQDGNLDAVVLYDNQTFTTLFGSGDGTFGSPGYNWFLSSGYSKFTIADMDIDGYPDIVALNSTGSFVTVLSNYGPSGGYPYDIYYTGATPVDFTVNDFNGDGSPDIAVIGNSSDSLMITLNDGFSYLSFTSNIGSNLGITESRITNGDFDNDGDIDLAFGSIANNSIDLIKNDGNAAFSGLTTIASFSGFPSRVYIYPVDFNADNKLDIVAVSGAFPQPNFTAVKNINGTSFTSTGFVSSLGLEEGTPGDFDGDGDIDFIINHGSQNYVRAENDGSGNFSFGYPASYSNLTNVASGDFDNDNDIDFFGVSDIDNLINPFLNQIFVTGSASAQCAGATFNLGYTGLGMTFNPANQFVVQLSDATGDFSSADTIGVVTSSAASGNISVTIPAGATSSSNYKVRVISSSPYNVASESSITINQLITPSVSIAASPSGAPCSGTSITFTPTPVSGGTPTYDWFVNGSQVFTGATFSTSSLANNDVVFAEMTSSLSCLATNPVTSNSITQSIITPLPVSVTISTATTGAPCAGTSITYTSSVTNGGGSPTYSWRVNGSPVGVTTPNFTTSTLNNNDVVTCRVTSSLSCVSGSPAISNGITQGITTPLPVSVSISQSPAGQVCAGTSVTYTATVVNGGTPSYQWFIGGTFCCTGSTFNTSAPVNGTTVQCIATSSLSCVSGSPASSNIITMNVLTPVAASVTIAASPSGAQCAGTNITYTATPTNGGTPGYQWTVNGLNVATGVSFSSSTLNNGDVVEAEMTSSLGCVSNNPATSNSVTQQINPILPVSVTISAVPSGAQCAGTSITYTANAVNIGTGTYQWRVNGSPVGVTTSSFTTSSLNNGDIVTCRITSNLSCVSGNPATSNAITQLITPGAAVTVTISANPGNIICAGSNVTFTAVPNNGGATPSYQWKINGSNVGLDSPTFSTTALSNGQVVSCELTSSLACATGNPATSNTITMTVNPQLVPVLSIASSPSGSQCPGTNISFTTTITNGGSSPVINWFINSINTGSTGTTFNTSSWSNGDVVGAVLTSNATCANPLTANSNLITLNALPAPVPSVSIVASPGNTICSGASVTFTATPVNGGLTPIYNWKVNGTNTQSGASNTFTTSTLVNGDVVTTELISNAACASPTNTTSNSVVMNVTVSLAPVLSIIDNCGSSDITASGFTGSLTWSDAGSGNPRNVISGTYSVTQTISGCVSPASNSVTAAPLPVPATSSIIGNITPPCNGTGVTYSVTLTSGSTYNWTVPTGAVITAGASGPDNNSITVNFGSNNGNIAVTETNSSGCAGSPQSLTISLQGCGLAANFSANITSVCSGQTVTFTDLSTGTSGSTTYSWNFGAGASPASITGAGPHIVTYSGSGSSTVSLTITDGASSTFTQTNYITINTIPAAPTLSIVDNCGNSTITASGVSGSLTWSDAGSGNPRTVVSGSYTVTQTVSGCVSSNSNSVTANPIPVPSAPTLSVVDNCGNSTITASGVSGTLTWSDAGSGNPRTVVSGSYMVTQTVSGCVSANSNTVTANPIPVPLAPTLSIVDNCGNSTITASGVSGTLNWSDAGSGNPRTVVSGSYTVTQTVSGCVSANSNSVTANPIPVPSAPILSIVNNCGNSTITASSVSGTLNWSDAGSGNPRTVASGTFTVTQTVSGCTSANSNAVTANPNSFPTTSGISGNNNPACNATGVIYNVTLTAGSNYAWTVPAGASITSGTSGPDNNSITVDFGSSNGNVSVTETNSAGCIGSSQSLAITLQGCGLAAEFIADATTICSGQSVTFTDLSTGTSGSTSYSWDFGAGASPATITGAGPHIVAYTGSGSSTVTLTVTDGFSDSEIKTNYINITTSPVPTVTLSSDMGSVICNGTQVTFTASETNGGTNPVYDFALNGSSVQIGSSNQFISSTLADGDNVTCTLTSDISCASPNPVTSLPIVMSVNTYSGPIPDLTSYTVSICTGASTDICLYFGGFSSFGGPSTTVLWSPNGENTDCITASDSGMYSAVLTDFNGCQYFSDTVTVNEINCTLVIDTCSYDFTDSGGPTGDYSDNETFTWTFNPTIAGNMTQAAFNSFETEDDIDILNIYDGPSTSDPLIGTFDGLSSPGTITATNPSGSLTFEFISDGSVVLPGWDADISCVGPPCTPTISLNVSPGTTVCYGTPVTFTAVTTDEGTSPNYEFFVDGFSVQNGSVDSYATSGLFGGETINCILTSNAPCVDTTMVTSPDIVMDVNYYNGEFPFISSTNVSLCQGASTVICLNLSFGSFAAFGGPPQQILWSPGGETTDCITVNAAGFPAQWDPKLGIHVT